MKKNGFTGLELLGIIVLFGLITIFATVKISYAFSDDPDGLYKSEQKLILTVAKNYGKDNLNDIKEHNNSRTITVNDLIIAGYLSPTNSDGDYLDPRDSKRKMNDINIKLTYDQEKDEIKTDFME